MKSIKWAGLILGFVGLVASGSVLADPMARHGSLHDGGWHGGGHGGWHGGWRGGVIIGAPLFWPYYGVPYAAYPYAPYPYAYAPVVVSPAAPPEYIEQGQEQAAAPPRWYFCKDPKGYYPYVKQCPSGWQTVVPPAPSSN